MLVSHGINTLGRQILPILKILHGCLFSLFLCDDGVLVVIAKNTATQEWVSDSVVWITVEHLLICGVGSKENIEGAECSEAGVKLHPPNN